MGPCRGTGVAVGGGAVRVSIGEKGVGWNEQESDWLGEPRFDDAVIGQSRGDATGYCQFAEGGGGLGR